MVHVDSVKVESALVFRVGEDVFLERIVAELGACMTSQSAHFPFE